MAFPKIKRVLPIKKMAAIHREYIRKSHLQVHLEPLENFEKNNILKKIIFMKQVYSSLSISINFD